MKPFAALLLIVGCTTPVTMPSASHPDPTLKPQLKFSVDDIQCDGTCTAPRKSLSKISFVPPDKTHLLLINSCARQVEIWQPQDGRKIEYGYTPAFDVETKGSCPVLLTAVTTLGELHRGIVDFVNVGANNPATVEVMCNGLWNTFSGAFLCSVASGLPVVLNSKTPAVLASAPDSGCPEPRGAISSFRIETTKPAPGKSGICVYVLLNKNKEEFRLTVNTYSSILGKFPSKGN